MATNETRPLDRAIESEIEQARDTALEDVLRRHQLVGKKFHNEAVVREVAHVVAEMVLAAVTSALKLAPAERPK